jgi:hypothetical protein
MLLCFLHFLQSSHCALMPCYWVSEVWGKKKYNMILTLGAAPLFLAVIVTFWARGKKNSAT